MQQRRKWRLMLCSDGLGRHLSQPTLCQSRVGCEPGAGIYYLQYGCESSFHVQRWLEQQRVVITRAGEWWREVVGVCWERRWVFFLAFYSEFHYCCPNDVGHVLCHWWQPEIRWRSSEMIWRERVAKRLSLRDIAHRNIPNTHHATTLIYTYPYVSCF